jgi:hypothetical protein
MTKEDLRKSFERIISRSPFERSIARYPDDEIRYAWPGGYVERDVSLAWEMFQEGAQAADHAAREECADICESQASCEGIGQECAGMIRQTIGGEKG